MKPAVQVQYLVLSVYRCIRTVLVGNLLYFINTAQYSTCTLNTQHAAAFFAMGMWVLRIAVCSYSFYTAQAQTVGSTRYGTVLYCLYSALYSTGIQTVFCFKPLLYIVLILHPYCSAVLLYVHMPCIPVQNASHSAALVRSNLVVGDFR
jgi:hypothetical protein